MKRTKRNPSAKWILLAFKGRTRMHFDGSKFTTQGKAKRFPDSIEAATFGRDLRKRFPVLAKFRLRVEPLRRINRGELLKNPSGFRRGVDAYARELDQADDLLNSFAGRSARETLAIKEPAIKAGLVVGNVLGVMYETIRDGKQEKYCHEFKRTSRPLLIANHDGSRIGIVGGRYRFTERGIEDV
jgi:hypothetical protein